MNEQKQNHDQGKPDYKCERCWSSENIILFQKSVFLGEDAQGFVVLCGRCKEEAPKELTQEEFENLFLRFASVKELLQHYDATDEAEAIKRWQEKGGDKESNVEESADEIPSPQIATDDKNEHVPPGYHVKNGEYNISREEADIVEKIFEKYLSGNTMERIARGLVRSDGNGGLVWSVGRVREILKDPIYAGYVLKGQDAVKGEHDPIINIEIFNKVQQRIVRNIRNPKYLYKPLILGD